MKIKLGDLCQILSDIQGLERIRYLTSHPIDIDDNLLYVGKSKSLRNRVRSYFRSKEKHSPRIRLMILQIVSICRKYA